jgi:glutaredoxin 3
MITVFTTNTCAYCKMVKQYLTLKGKEFTEVNLHDNPEIHQQLIEKTGVMTVPITQVGEDNFIIGFNREKLAAVI